MRATGLLVLLAFGLLPLLAQDAHSAERPDKDLHRGREHGTVDQLLELMIVELKAAAPLCDPDDTQEIAIVSAVTEVIRRMRMTNQVMLTSLSPTLLYLAAAEAPEITRILSISGLQFLTALEVEAALGLPVTTGVRIVEADLFFLNSAGASFVDALHGLGLKALGFTATDLPEWLFLESLGLDGIYTNDIPLGVKHQAPIP